MLDVSMYDRERLARIRKCILTEFEAYGFSHDKNAPALEQRAGRLYINHCADDISANDIAMYDQIFTELAPKIENGYVVFDVNVSYLKFSRSAQAQISALIFFSENGTDFAARKNPVVAFNDEYKASCDTSGKLRPDSRIGRLRVEDFDAYKKQSEVFSVFWDGYTYRFPSELAAAALKKHGLVLKADWL